MPDLLLDSDVIIEALRGNAVILKELSEVRHAGWVMSYTPIAKAEIYHGLRRGEEKLTEGFFTVCRSIVITDDVGEQAGRYLAAYHCSHGIEIADALMAAAARCAQATLFTLSQKHYHMKDIQFHALSGSLH